MPSVGSRMKRGAVVLSASLKRRFIVSHMCCFHCFDGGRDFYFMMQKRDHFSLLLGICDFTFFAQSVCVKLASPQAARLGIFEFDFDVSDWTMQVVTHKSKIKIMPYNSVQMIDSTLSFDLLLPRGTLMTKTLHQSRILCMLLSVIEAYDHFL